MAELDDAYANAAYIPGAAEYPERWAMAAESFRADMVLAGRARLNMPYGSSERQAFDLFLPDGAALGLCVFVHGGYWLRFDRSYWSHFAAGVLANGWACALPSYDLAPSVTIAQITQQIAAVIPKIAALVPGPMTLTGHSAGGHLVSRMLAADMLPDGVRQRLECVVPISPVSDLRPLLQTSMNAQFKMTPEDAEVESPVLQPRPDCAVHVWVGADERPVFLDQAKWLSDAWAADLTIAPGKHHFDVIDALTDETSGLVRALVCWQHSARTRP